MPLLEAISTNVAALPSVTSAPTTPRGTGGFASTLAAAQEGWSPESGENAGADGESSAASGADAAASLHLQLPGKPTGSSSRKWAAASAPGAANSVAGGNNALSAPQPVPVPAPAPAPVPALVPIPVAVLPNALPIVPVAAPLSLPQSDPSTASMQAPAIHSASEGFPSGISASIPFDSVASRVPSAYSDLSRAYVTSALPGKAGIGAVPSSFSASTSFSASDGAGSRIASGNSLPDTDASSPATLPAANTPALSPNLSPKLSGEIAENLASTASVLNSPVLNSPASNSPAFDEAVSNAHISSDLVSNDASSAGSVSTLRGSDSLISSDPASTVIANEAEAAAFEDDGAGPEASAPVPQAGRGAARGRADRLYWPARIPQARRRRIFLV